ncbi:hypothetical protein E8E14_000454 [Neopestalotiopsis sp. 37M]|nr:hypothetical protein E8E14_000454 [Neopestalotiopsis sp. 37M]
MEIFEYQPIIHEEHAFRLVRLLPGTGLNIHAEIVHASLEEKELIEYEAVSYVWGSSVLASSICFDSDWMSRVGSLLSESELSQMYKGNLLLGMQVRERHYEEPISKVYADIVNLLLLKGANMEYCDWLGRTPLWWAVNHGHLAVVEILLREKADALAMGSDGLLPLSWALWNGHYEVAKKLLDQREHYPEFQISRSGEYGPVRWAIHNGDESQLRLLLEKGFDVTVGAPLRWAISDGHVAIVKHLLSNKFITGKLSKKSALPLAVSTGNETIVEALLVHVMDTEVFHHGLTPLMMAARDGHCTIVKLLLSKNAKPNAKDKKNQTPLMYAAKHGFTDVVEVLLKHNADVSAETARTNMTSLWLAASGGHQDVIQLLLRHGADIDASGLDGDTVLMAASRRGHTETVRFLIENHVQVCAKNHDGYTALDWAESRDHTDVAELLREKMHLNT